MSQGSHRIGQAVALPRLRTIVARSRQSMLSWSAPTPALDAAKCLVAASASPTHTSIKHWCLRRAASGAAQARAFSTSPGLVSPEDKSPTEPITVFVRLSPAAPLEGLGFFGKHVYELKDAVMVKFNKRFAGLDPDELQLFKVDGSSCILLSPAQTLLDAGVVAGTVFAVELTIAAPTIAAPAPVTALSVLLCDASTDGDVYAVIGGRARTAVDSARNYRAKLAGVSALTGLKLGLSSADAVRLGITVLRESPAAFEDFARHDQQILLLPQRLDCVFEALDAVKNGIPFGVRLSGPNGVGKSAILLLLHLICIARGLPSLYIPRAEALVNAALEERGGDAFILDTFWRQNADLVVASPVLRRVFLEALQDAEHPFTPHVMEQLRQAIGTPGLPGLAVIMDEVQHISSVVKAAKVESPSAGVQCAGVYFSVNWTDWTNSDAVFQCVSAASAHAERDAKLPVSDADRHLRIIEPLNSADRDALQKSPSSPAYVRDSDARSFVVRIAGGVLRKLVKCAKTLPRDRSPTKKDLVSLWQSMWDGLRVDCAGSLNSLASVERDTAASQVMSLLSGDVRWGSAASLYGSGIVFRSAASPFVKPVSEAAAAVLLRVTSAYLATTRTRISSISDGRLRGFELERQVVAQIDSFLPGQGVPCKLLDGTPAPALDLQCSYILPFFNLNDVVELNVAVLYRPISLTFPCDAILMPAAGSGGVAYVIKCSTTDPTMADRVSKVGDYFRCAPTAGVVTALQDRGVVVIVVLFYDGHLPVRSRLSAEAVAISSGQAPGPTAASSSSSALPRRAAAAAGASGGSLSSTAQMPKQKLTGTALAPRQRAQAELGHVIRVVDAPSLVQPLGLLV